VDRAEAEAIYDAGRDVVVEVLLRMDRQIRELSETVARQGERIAMLERRLTRSPRNSSQPPSADPPGTPPRRGKDSGGRRQGGQPGHEDSEPRPCLFDAGFPLSGLQDRTHTSDLNVRTQHTRLALRAQLREAHALPPCDIDNPT
jgi:hypothetical protein